MLYGHKLGQIQPTRHDKLCELSLLLHHLQEEKVAALGTAWLSNSGKFNPQNMVGVRRLSRRN